MTETPVYEPEAEPHLSLRPACLAEQHKPIQLTAQDTQNVQYHLAWKGTAHTTTLVFLDSGSVSSHHSSRGQLLTHSMGTKADRSFKHETACGLADSPLILGQPSVLLKQDRQILLVSVGLANGQQMFSQYFSILAGDMHNKMCTAASLACSTSVTSWHDEQLQTCTTPGMSEWLRCRGPLLSTTPLISVTRHVLIFTDWDNYGYHLILTCLQLLAETIIIMNQLCYIWRKPLRLWNKHRAVPLATSKAHPHSKFLQCWSFHKQRGINPVRLSGQVTARWGYLAREANALEDLDRCGLAFILGVGEQLSWDLGDLIKKGLLCLQKLLPVVGEMLPHLHTNNVICNGDPSNTERKQKKQASRQASKKASKKGRKKEWQTRV